MNVYIIVAGLELGIIYLMGLNECQAFFYNYLHLFYIFGYSQACFNETDGEG